MPSVGGKASPGPFANEEEVDFQERLCYWGRRQCPPSIARGALATDYCKSASARTLAVQNLSTLGSSHCWIDRQPRVRRTAEGYCA